MCYNSVMKVRLSEQVIKDDEITILGFCKVCKRTVRQAFRKFDGLCAECTAKLGKTEKLSNPTKHASHEH